ncbi:NB-ARC domain-containing protein [Saccharothrix saharensis]|uniref:NB-ARC domain-containing protein n=1 Tax=Saccharothrix saharensis TaxID=571190 RepID=A0A543JDN8_9PSEU|nr:NB-ARC domain-containing protein [Saccharothrix saharensis]TQM80922.1 NB-ARC domain-containing protein [Saccharothrix saharensis]
MADAVVGDGAEDGDGQHAFVVGSGVVVQAGRDAVVTIHQATRRVAWPVRVGVPPPLAEHYQERRGHALLTEALAAHRPVVVIGAHRGAGVVVSGLGGVGKSQLAAWHAWQVWSDAHVDVAVWLSALGRDAVVTAYAEAARRVLVEDDPLIAERPPEQAAAAFRAWLAGTARRWLVVLDDVQDPADVRGLVPPPGAGGQVIVTSRLRDAALTSGRDLIELDVFTEAEALDYLAGALGDRRDADREQFEGLAGDLGWLPLALGQAVAFIVDQPLLTVAAYRALFADRRRTLADLAPAEGALPEHQATIATTWSLSIDRADRSGGRGLASKALRIASVLDANGAPLAVFTSRPVLGHLGRSAWRRVRVDDVLDALTRLHRFNLITLTPTATSTAADDRTHLDTGAVRVHALVQRSVRDDLGPRGVSRAARAAAAAMTAVWPHGKRDADLEAVLRANAIALASVTDPATWSWKVYDLLKLVGESLGGAGSPAAAFEHLSRVREWALQGLGRLHPKTLAIQSRRAAWRGDSGDPAGAVADFQQLARDMRRVWGGNNKRTLIARRELARWRGIAGDPVAAVAALEEVTASMTRRLGADHAETLVARSNLAYWRGTVGDPAGAAAEFAALSADYERLFGADHLDSLITRRELAKWRAAAGDPARAVVELEDLVPDMVRLLGVVHVDTLSARSNLAYWRATSGDVGRAVVEFEHLLADSRRHLAGNHPHTLTTRRELAKWRAVAGDPARAVVELEALVSDMVRVLGVGHVDTLSARSNLAHWRAVAGDVGRAVAEFEDLLTDSLHHLATDHPHTSTTRDELARWRTVRNNPPTPPSL